MPGVERDGLRRRLHGDSRGIYSDGDCAPSPVRRARFRWHRDAEGHWRRDLRPLRAARVARHRRGVGAERNFAARRAAADVGAGALPSAPRRSPTRARSAHLRPGLDALLDGGAAGGRVAVAGVGRLRLLHRGAARASGSARFERRYFNATRFIDGRIEVDFPHADAGVRPLRRVQRQGVRRGARRRARARVHRRRRQRSLRHRARRPHLRGARLAAGARLRRARRRARRRSTTSPRSPPTSLRAART